MHFIRIARHRDCHIFFNLPSTQIVADWLLHLKWPTWPTWPCMSFCSCYWRHTLSWLCIGLLCGCSDISAGGMCDPASILHSRDWSLKSALAPVSVCCSARGLPIYQASSCIFLRRLTSSLIRVPTVSDQRKASQTPYGSVCLQSKVSLIDWMLLFTICTHDMFHSRVYDRRDCSTL